MTARLALGTVQFGFPYGIANKTGQVSAEEAARILAAARDAGLDTLDTAIAYGESERRLGEIGVEGWRVITKLPPLPKAEARVTEWVRRSVEDSLARLRLAEVTGLMLHRSADLLEGDRGAELYGALCELRSRGVVARIGISIYDPAELEALQQFPVGIVQAPFNVLDRRLATSGWLERLCDTGVEVHTRSAFLQGLLLMPPEVRPARFERWTPLWRRWDEWLRASGCTALEACLAFSLGTAGIERVLVGVDSARQFREILAASATCAVALPDDLASEDLQLINPVNWRAS